MYSYLGHKTGTQLLVKTGKPIKYNRNKNQQKTSQLRKLKSNIYFHRSLAYPPCSFVLV